MELERAKRLEEEQKRLEAELRDREEVRVRVCQCACVCVYVFVFVCAAGALYVYVYMCMCVYVLCACVRVCVGTCACVQWANCPSIQSRKADASRRKAEEEALQCLEAERRRKHEEVWNIRRKRGIRPFSMRLVCTLIIFSVNGVIVLKNSPHTLPYVAIDKRWLLFSHIENQGLNNFPFPTNQSTWTHLPFYLFL